VLKVVNPSVIYGLHFVLHPGYLYAVNDLAEEIPIVLVQHGHIGGLRALGFHDFRGAENVILWGRREQEELESRDNIPVPLSIVVGNPKLAYIKNQLDESATKSNRVNVLYVSSAGGAASLQQSRRALQIFNKALTNLEQVSIEYRPHPLEDVQNFPEESMGSDVSKEDIVSAPGVYEHLTRADIIVGTQSTVLLEAVALGVPVIQLLPEQATTDWDPGIVGANSVGRLTEEIRDILDDDAYRDQLIRQEQEYVKGIFKNIESNSVIPDAASVLKKHI
jgi:UDP-N-acetylglucosamine 2-epimerase